MSYVVAAVLNSWRSVGCVSELSTAMLQNGCYHAIGCLYNRATFSLHLWFRGENKERQGSCTKQAFWTDCNVTFKCQETCKSNVSYRILLFYWSIHNKNTVFTGRGQAAHRQRGSFLSFKSGHKCLKKQRRRFQTKYGKQTIKTEAFNFTKKAPNVDI